MKRIERAAFARHGFLLGAGLVTVSALGGCGEDAALAPEVPSSPVVVDSPKVVAKAALRIEELCPGNVDLQDEDGDDPGWVELRNLTDSIQPMGRWRLSNGVKDVAWRLPDSLLGPGARTLIFLSGKDRLRMLPAGDSVSLFSISGAYAWSDSMNTPDAGHSTWIPWELPGLTGKLADGTAALSVNLHRADNSSTELEWSSASVGTRVPDSKVKDLTGRDRIVLRATIPAGQLMTVRFCEDGADCWKGSSVQFKGTGVVQDRYETSLLGVSANFTKITGFNFELPANTLGTLQFTITGIWAYRREVHPHGSFELSRKGGALILQDTAGLPSDTVLYPGMDDAISWVRDSATGTFALREHPTPGAANPVTPAPALLPAPTFVTASGFQPAPLTVQVKPVPGATVRCAEHGSLPVPSSRSIDSGWALDSSCVLRCAAFAPDGRQGPVSTGTFLLGESVSLPVIAVTADSNALFQVDTGIYAKGPNASPVFPYFGANFWRDVEIPAHVEMFESGRRNFTLPAGIGIYGNYSRANDKKSLSVQFREGYGARHVDWPLFPGHPELTRFKGFGLRNNGGNCGKDYVRDALMTSLTEGRGIEYQLSRHVLVFLNGKYWGIYELREKLDPDYLATRFGYDPASVDLLKNGSEVQAGTATYWNAVVRDFMGHDFSDSAKLERAATMVDLDNFSDYLSTEIWASNTDWPANNFRTWRRRDLGTPWRHMLFDLDAGLNSFGGQKDMLEYLLDTSVATDGYPNGEYSTVFFRRLSANPAWRERFINRSAALLSTNFSETRAQAALDSMQASIASEVPRDQQRWGFKATTQRVELKRMASFIAARPQQVREDFRTVYGLGADAPVSLSAVGGTLRLDGLALGSSYAGTHYAGHPVTLEAVASAGGTFAGWSDGVTDARRKVVVPADGLMLTATFR